MDIKSLVNFSFLIVLFSVCVIGVPTNSITEMSENGIGKMPEFKKEILFRGYTHCRSHEDCEENQCCMLGMMRYSTAVCTDYGKINDPCIPSNPKSKSYSLSYPHFKSAVEIKSAHLLYCPCSTSFKCDRDTNSCQKDI